MQNYSDGYSCFLLLLLQDVQRTYDDTWGDTNLSNFSIDYDKKIILPFIQSAFKNSGGNIKFIATPWSPPAWMKT